MTDRPIDGPLKWPGGKAYLAKEIVKLMPPRCQTPTKPDPKDDGWLQYVEPYFGGGSVLLANNPDGISEVVCDTNKMLTNFWCCLKDDTLFHMMQRQLEATPFSEREFDVAYRHITQASHFNFSGYDERVTAAVNFFVCCRQSLAGRMQGFTGITQTRVRRGMNNEVSAWLSSIEGLPQVHSRLKRVLIVNRDALKILQKHDGSQTLFYLDPPYLHETRVTRKEYGQHEMSNANHLSLLYVLGTLKGRFLLSGYRSAMYDKAATQYGWRRVDISIANHAAGGKSKKRMVECVWMNYEAAQ